MNILGAHIDSPRLDIKQVPLYEDSELVLMDTHYYGGIKKYQWVALPLALHGVVALKDGSVVEVCIGEDASDPVVGVSDLLIHLAGEQMSKKADKVIDSVDERGRELASKIYLFQGLPKADKMELVIQKAVELGAFEVIPVAMKRSVVKLDAKKAESKVKRWNAIAESAAKQSKRSILPQVSDVVTFAQAVKMAENCQIKYAPCFICCVISAESGSNTSAKMLAHTMS
jgi:hypothetical protein